MSLNDELVDQAIRHAHYFERLKTSEVTAILKFLEKDVYSDLSKRLQADLGAILAGQKITPARLKRLEALQKAVRGEIEAGMRNANHLLVKKLTKTGFHEAQWQAGVLTKALHVDMVTPSPQLVRSIVTSKPMEGALLSEWMKQQGTKTGFAVQRQINIGLAQGESVDQMVRRIRGTKAAQYADGVWGQSKREVDAIVRTSMNHVSAHAREETYAANEDVIKGVQLVATLDGRTSEICISYDGTTWPVNEGPRPPFHFRCRTTSVPVLKSWEELGFEGKEEIPESTRASMDGQVSSKTTYPEWLKKQPDSFQDEVLGKGKAELFRTGKVDITKFVDDQHRPLTLKQLQALEAAPKPVVSVPKVRVKTDAELMEEIDRLGADKRNTLPYEVQQDITARYERSPHSKYVTGLNEKRRAAVEEYQATAYRWMNDTARKMDATKPLSEQADKLGQMLKENVESPSNWRRSVEQMQQLEEVVAGAPPVPRTTVLTRFDHDLKLQPGTRYKSQGWLSAGETPQRYFADGSHVAYEILVREGAEGVLEGFNKSELEFLFNHGAEFRVVGVRENVVRHLGDRFTHKTYLMEYIGP